MRVSLSLLVLAMAACVVSAQEKKATKWVTVSSTPKVEEEASSEGKKTFTPLKVFAGESYASMDLSTNLEPSDIKDGLTIDNIKNMDKFPLEAITEQDEESPTLSGVDSEDKDTKGVKAAISLDDDLMSKLQEQLDRAQASKAKLEKESQVLKLKLELKKLSRNAQDSLGVLKAAKSQAKSLSESIVSSDEEAASIREKMEEDLAKNAENKSKAEASLGEKKTSISEMMDNLGVVNYQVHELKSALEGLMDGSIDTVDIETIEAAAMKDDVNDDAEADEITENLDDLMYSGADESEVEIESKEDIEEDIMEALIAEEEDEPEIDEKAMEKAAEKAVTKAMEKAAEKAVTKAMEEEEAKKEAMEEKAKKEAMEEKAKKEAEKEAAEKAEEDVLDALEVADEETEVDEAAGEEVDLDDLLDEMEAAGIDARSAEEDDEDFDDDEEAEVDEDIVEDETDSLAEELENALAEDSEDDLPEAGEEDLPEADEEDFEEDDLPEDGEEDFPEEEEVPEGEIPDSPVESPEAAAVGETPPVAPVESPEDAVLGETPPAELPSFQANGHLIQKNEESEVDENIVEDEADSLAQRLEDALAEDSEAELLEAGEEDLPEAGAPVESPEAAAVGETPPLAELPSFRANGHLIQKKRRKIALRGFN